MSMEAICVDAENMVAGRLASGIAKMLLKGENVVVVNAEKAVVSGDPAYNMEIHMNKVKRGDPYKGPFYPKRPDRIFQRMIRGMLPYSKDKGKKAFSRLRVFESVPEEYKGARKIRPRHAENRLDCKVVTIGQLARAWGAGS